ncbi:hypothetical protein [Streptomyces ficellus]|uniref:hypothetical protein n=1 Tax=Streptomyces ficellus TaxID=1977088 RepID=UPI003CC799AE
MTSGAARWARALPPWAVDAGIALLVLAAVTMPFVVPRDPRLPEATWAAYGLTALTVLPLGAPVSRMGDASDNAGSSPRSCP